MHRFEQITERSTRDLNNTTGAYQHVSVGQILEISLDHQQEENLRQVVKCLCTYLRSGPLAK